VDISLSLFSIPSDIPIPTGYMPRGCREGVQPVLRSRKSAVEMADMYFKQVSRAENAAIGEFSEYS